MQLNSEIWSGVALAPLAQGAVSPDATDEHAPIYGYVGGNGIVVSSDTFLPYVTRVPSVPPLIKLSAIPHFVLGLPAPWSVIYVVNTDGSAPTTVALPGNALGLDFAGAVDANGKLRIAVRLADGSVWVYDQP